MLNSEKQRGAFGLRNAKLGDVPRGVSVIWEAVPAEGAPTLVMMKSGLMKPLIAILGAPGMLMFAARSANSCSSSAGVWAIETWVAVGKEAQLFSAFVSMPPVA